MLQLSCLTPVFIYIYIYTHIYILGGRQWSDYSSGWEWEGWVFYYVQYIPEAVLHTATHSYYTTLVVTDTTHIPDTANLVPLTSHERCVTYTQYTQLSSFKYWLMHAMVAAAPAACSVRHAVVPDKCIYMPDHPRDTTSTTPHLHTHTHSHTHTHTHTHDTTIKINQPHTNHWPAI